MLLLKKCKNIAIRSYIVVRISFKNSIEVFEKVTEINSGIRLWKIVNDYSVLQLTIEDLNRSEAYTFLHDDWIDSGYPIPNKTFPGNGIYSHWAKLWLGTGTGINGLKISAEMFTLV